MNKRFIAIGLAGALSFAAAFSGIIPGALIGNDVSTVYASVTTKVTRDSDIGISFAHKDPSKYADGSYIFSSAKSTLAINEKRTAIVSGGITTAIKDSDSAKKYVDSNGNLKKTDTTYSYRKLALADLTNWKSSNTKVATVANGVVTGLSVGNSKISAEYKWVDENGTAKTGTVSTYVYVQEIPAFERLINESIYIYAGDSYTIGAPKLAKGTTYDPSTLTYMSLDLGNGTKYDQATSISSGPYASLDTKTGVLTAKAYGRVHVVISARDNKNHSYTWMYGFTIIPRPGTVLTDVYGKAKYKVLPNASDSSKESRVAFLGFVHTPRKAVVPAYAYTAGGAFKVTEIGENAFRGKKVTSVRLPRTIKKIGKNAFNKCKKLTSLDLSSTEITKLDDGAISGCPKLNELIINGNKLKKFGKNSVSVSGKTKIYVESSSRKVYKDTVKKMKNKKVGGNKAKYIEQD